LCAQLNDVEKKLKALGIGRFQVMALLQAARYYKLLGDLEKAKSFGLNRAVFYAWVKYYGSREPRIPVKMREEDVSIVAEKGVESKCPEGYVLVLGECIKQSPRGVYEIGGVEQTPADYDQQVTHKIRRVADPERVWRAALEYVSKFPDWVLKNPQHFYKYVYEPVRDTFFAKILRGEQVEPPREILERFRALEEMIEKARKAQRTLLDYAGKPVESSTGSKQVKPPGATGRDS